ncbi:MAG: rRNA maturation RNase YbeY [Chthonomonas sp.]|nr:rRNA maturation RNase YbeY [Chthonomonas sp.]
MEAYEAPHAEVTVLITDDRQMAQLNEQFRDVASTTDVLSFPAPAHVAGHLGDIAISYDVAALQARMRGVSTRDEIAMLAIHGGLHLLGYDDEQEADREDMIQRMNAIASQVGLPTDSDWRSGHYDA